MPSTFPDGLDCSIISSKVLNKVVKKKLTKYDLEHVTSYFKKKKKYKIFNLISESKEFSNINISVDTYNDYLIIKKFISKLGIFCNFEDLKKFFKLNMSIFEKIILEEIMEIKLMTVKKMDFEKPNYSRRKYVSFKTTRFHVAKIICLLKNQKKLRMGFK